ncbi:MAG: YggS family pyridoxal phosphate-dependent enzyme [Myxococcota bacterium]
MPLTAEEIRKNIKEIQTRIENACKRSKRDYESVRLIAVSKGVRVEQILVAYESGIKDFGENYVQEMQEKIELHPKDIKWHFIGHLQTNKIKHLLGKVNLIQTVYKMEHLLEIEKRYKGDESVQNLLLEVNIGNEPTKSGIRAEDATGLVKNSLNFCRLRIIGLMCIPPISEVERVREYFKNLRFLKDCINKSLGKELLSELSMGMSSDFEVAIEEGATMVRVGTAIFGERVRGGIK